MMFKNSAKLLIANFSTVWKLILYYIIVIGITIGLVAPFFGLLGAEFNATGTLDRLGELLASFNVSVNFLAFVTELNLIFVSIINTFLALFVTHTWVAIYLTLLVTYIVPVLFGLVDLPVGQTLFGYMSSLTKYNFVGSFASMLGRSIRYQLFKNLVYLPINILIVGVFIATLKLTLVGGLMVYFLPVIMILSILTLIALKRSVFSGWMPAIVVYDCNMFVALGKGAKAVFKRFARILSTALIVSLFVFVFTYILGTYALLIVIPVSMMWFYVFEMVAFYSSQGMRFYVDLDTIVKSKLLEECDSFKKVKNII